MKLTFYLALIFLGFNSSCKVINETSKYEFKDGVYKTKIQGKAAAKAYVLVEEDSLLVFPSSKGAQFDSTTSYSLSFPPAKPISGFSHYNFIKTSIDLDVLTILFKYRPSVSTLPNQLNTNLNGALYFGMRADRYSLKYSKTAINSHHRNITHYGYSFGVFTGLGSTAMNPWVTNSAIDQEYDGVVIPYGVAAIVGINNISFGLSLGFDYLIDKNYSTWVYKGKPWTGLVVGLNLN